MGESTQSAGNGQEPKGAKGLFVRLHLAVLFHPRLTPFDIRLYAAYSKYQGKHRSCQVKAKTIASQTGMSRHAVINSTRILSEEGLIEVDTTKRPNVIRVLPIKDVFSPAYLEAVEGKGYSQSSSPEPRLK